MPSLIGKPRSIPAAKLAVASARPESFLYHSDGPRKAAFCHALGCRPKVRYPRSLPTASFHLVICVRETMMNQIRKVMKPRNACTIISAQICHRISATFFALVLFWLGPCVVFAQQTESPAPTQQAQSQVMTTTTSDQETAKLLPQELDSLVAPIALYSDPLLAQTLAASTYPLEIIQLQQWMERNKNLTGKALADAVAKQPWDPSVQGLVEFPDVVQRTAGNVQWTTDLGNAFLAQQSDVMDAVQRMRGKAQGTGNLKTSAQQVVETQTVAGGTGGGSGQVIEIQQANPDVVYVPSYDTTVVYGAAP